MKHVIIALIACGLVLGSEPMLRTAWAAPKPKKEREITKESEAALERGLKWLAENQGPDGSWGSKHLGLVAMGLLAFLSAGHMPDRGKYGKNVRRALDFIIRNAKKTDDGLILLNMAEQRRDMYNHGLACFVLGQAYGMTKDKRLSKTLDGALKLIYAKQCADGGWDYVARSQRSGHDLSLCVMQAKAIRSAMDSGLDVPTDVIKLAIKDVRAHYKASIRNQAGQSEETLKKVDGWFTYDGRRVTPAMAAAGVVCLQEFGQYDDWRIGKNIKYLQKQIQGVRFLARRKSNNGYLPFDAYTLYYIGQAMYQAGGKEWKANYRILRDAVVNGQVLTGSGRGSWRAGRWVSGDDSQLYGTAVGCFILAIPNRYLPILQEGKIESVRKKLSGKK